MATKPTSASRQSSRARATEHPDIAGELGAKLRAIRQAAGITLKQAEAMTGVPHATISRVETNKMSPTLTLLSKIVAGLGVPWSAVLPASVVRKPEFGSDVSFSSDLAAGIRLGRRDFVFLHSNNPLSTRVAPFVMSTRNRTLAEAGGLGGHPDIEFCFVIEGTLRLHLKGRPSHVLATGESALFEATIPHAYTSVGEGPTRCLITTIPLPDAPPRERATPALRRLVKS
jgi:transcriptional regulator with XRE-family HTH domain